MLKRKEVIRYLKTWPLIIIAIVLNGELTFNWHPAAWWMDWALGILSWIAITLAILFRDYVNRKAP